MYVNFALLPGSFLLFITMLLAVALAAFAWARRSAPGARYFSFFMLSAAFWAACDGIENLMLTPETKIFWARMAYIGISFLPAFWLNFTLTFSKQEKYLKNTLLKVLLWLIPLVTLIMAWTNDQHHLLWSQIEPVAGSPELIYRHGPWFWIYAVFTYSTLLAGTVSILFTILVRSPIVYRRQAGFIIIGTLFPWVFNFLYLLRLNPFPGTDLTSFGFSLAGAFYVWSLFQFRLFDLLPVARDMLVESMSDGVMVLDASCRILDVNPAALRMMGVTSRELLGQQIEKKFNLPPNTFVLPNAPLHPASDAAYLPGSKELEMIIPREPQVTLDLHITPLYRIHSEHAGWLIVIRDITDRKRIEEELRKARDAAEAASRYKSEFLANMSHEIRTPMNAVIGMTSLLLDTHINDEQRDWLEIIHNSSEALMGIINDILDYSRIESGKLPLEQNPFSLRTCIEESLDVVAVRAAEKDLELLYDIDDQMPDILTGDVMRLRQVLVNLLNNAVKFTPSGEVLLSVHGGASFSLEPGSASNEQRWLEVHFAVKDTGIGIPQDRVDRLFQPFSQVDSSITRKFGGSGLGLAICKRIVEMMGGRIWVESEANKGSTFYFTVWSPVSDEYRAVQPEYIRVLEKKRLLIVDRSATSCHILARMAERAGMQVFTALSVNEALAELKKPQPRTRNRFLSLIENAARGERSVKPEPNMIDILLVDRRLPDVERVISAYKDVPAILMSPPSRSGSTGRLEYTMRLHKPVRPSRFYSALARSFDAQFRDPALNVQEEMLLAYGNGLYESQSFMSLRDAVPAHEEALQEPSSQAAEPLVLPDLRILLAEDNSTNQKVIQLVLKQFGIMKTEVVEDGSEAVQALERKNFDLILMDVQMPEMDGLEATRYIRAMLPEDRQPYIIALTANAMSGDRERCLEAGMNDYLSKPVRMDELENALRQYRQIRAQSTPPAEPTPVPVPVLVFAESSGALDEDGIVDRSVFEALVEFLGPDGRDSMAEVVGLFRQNTPKLLAQLDTSLNTLDLHTLRRAAHTIKSSSGNLGVMRLAACARALEEQLDTLISLQSPDHPPHVTPQIVLDIAAQIDQIRRAYEQASNVLTREGY